MLEGWPGEKLLLKLHETLIEKGLSTLWRPFVIRREGRARSEVQAEKIRMIAQAKRDADDIRARRLTYDGTSVVVPELQAPMSHLPSTSPSVGERPFLQLAEQHSHERSVSRAINLIKTIFKAEDLIEEENSPADEVSSKPVSEDWLARWRNLAEEASAEEVQLLWAAVLKNEVRKPGTYSIRTLLKLNELSTADAELITEFAGFVVSNAKTDFIIADNRWLDSVGITIAKLLTLTELGILHGGTANATTIVRLTSSLDSSFEAAWIMRDRGVVFRHSDPTNVLKCTAYILTSVGQEIMRLPSTPADPRGLIEIAHLGQRRGFSASLGRTVNRNGDLFLTDLEPLPNVVPAD
jgi:hypothetical protein